VRTLPAESQGVLSPTPASSKTQVVLCSEQECDLWDQFVTATRDSTIAHLFCWQRVVQEAYGHRGFYLIASKGREIVGVLPLVRVKGFWLGNTLCSMPFLDYGGILAPEPVVVQLLLNHALTLRDKCRADALELRHQQPVEAGGELRLDKVSMVLDISAGRDGVWNNLPAKVRNQVRKAAKEGLCTHFGGADLLEEFYSVFAVNMRELGSPVHNMAFFAAILKHFRKDAGVIVVREGTKTVGGLLYLFYKESIIVPWASSLRNYFSKCPNNLLYWEAMQMACGRACHSFDFGRSSIGSGTYKFKEQWGAKPVQLNWQLFPRKNLPAPTPLSQNPKYLLAARLWRHLPLSVTILLGPHIRKFITN